MRTLPKTWLDRDYSMLKQTNHRYERLTTHYPNCQDSTLPSPFGGFLPRLFLLLQSWNDRPITNIPTAMTDWLMSPLCASVSAACHTTSKGDDRPVVLGERPVLDGGHSTRGRCSMGEGKEAERGRSFSTLFLPDRHQMALAFSPRAPNTAGSAHRRCMIPSGKPIRLADWPE